MAIERFGARIKRYQLGRRQAQWMVTYLDKAGVGECQVAGFATWQEAASAAAREADGPVEFTDGAVEPSRVAIWFDALESRWVCSMYLPGEDDASWHEDFEAWPDAVAFAARIKRVTPPAPAPAISLAAIFDEPEQES